MFLPLSLGRRLRKRGCTHSRLKNEHVHLLLRQEQKKRMCGDAGMILAKQFQLARWLGYETLKESGLLHSTAKALSV